MRPSPYKSRVVDVMEELMKFALLLRGRTSCLLDRYSGLCECAIATAHAAAASLRDAALG